MSLQACADIVRKGDPDRFMAAMAAPVEARRVLFPLYAFNVEVARAPWVVSEPMIGEMRLQWWRDALDEIAGPGQVRQHEVATPLGEVLDAKAARALDGLVAARRWDLYRDPFEDEAHFDLYVRSASALTWAAARLLGAKDGAAAQVKALGQAAALARFLQAVPDLEARGCVPLVDGRPDAVRKLAERALAALPDSSALRAALPGAARGAVLEGWLARPVLTQVFRDPLAVAEGRLGVSEFRKRVSLFWASL